MWNPFNLITQVVSPIAGAFEKRTEAKTQVKLKQIDRLQSADDKLAEWESIVAENSNDSWKDEWVTLIITMPIPVIFLAVIISTLTGDPKIAQAAKDGVTAIKELLPDYDNLLYVVCLAAMGIRALKR